MDLTGGMMQQLGQYQVDLRRDARMGTCYDEMVSDFGAAGGTLMLPYTDVRSGFNILNSIYDAGNPEWDALVAAQKLASGAEPAVVPAPVPAAAPAPAPAKPVTNAAALASLTPIDKATTAAGAVLNARKVDPAQTLAAIDKVIAAATAAMTSAGAYRR